MTISISPPCTAADREKSGGAAKHEQSTNVRGDTALSRISSRAIEAQGGEKLSKDQRRRKRKAMAFFAKLQQRRQIPGNCRRCGKHHPDKSKKICAKCRAHHNEYYRRKAQAAQGVNIVELQRRVASLENELARMLIDRRAAYAKGYTAGTRRKAKAQADNRYFDAYPTISAQELSTMNHAYTSLEER